MLQQPSIRDVSEDRGILTTEDVKRDGWERSDRNLDLSNLDLRHRTWPWFSRPSQAKLQMRRNSSIKVQGGFETQFYATAVRQHFSINFT